MRSLRQFSVNLYRRTPRRTGGATTRDETTCCRRGIHNGIRERQGRWKGDAFMMYVRVTRSEEEDRVSRALSSNAAAGGIQPGYYYRGKSSGEGAE